VRTARVKRATTIVAFWRDGRFVLENYLTRTLITADPVVTWLLDFFSEWRSPAKLAQLMPQYTKDSIYSTLCELAKRTFLVREGTPEARLDAQLDRTWSQWLPHAGFFHFATKDAHYCNGKRGVETLLRQLLAESPQPPFFKRYRKNPMALPSPTQPKGEFLPVLLKRRTHREFSPAPLKLSTLSNLLYYTWGVTSFLQSPLLGSLPLKTSPSAGARHSIEVYLLPLRVERLPRQLYHYAPGEHCLERLSIGTEELRGKAVRYCAGQKWVKDAAALFLMTAVFPRVMWKYRSARAYRTVLLDAGHICQTFCLVATWLGLYPFCTMALKDTLIEKDLSLDGIRESVLYVAGVGLSREARTRSRLAASL
jgi:SagB-type dehydrogenase family enzyme